MVCLACRATAQLPAIAQNGVVNQASQIAPSLAGGALARGARIEIRGIRFAAGSTVTLVGRDTRVSLPIFASTITRIDAMIPKDAPLGAGDIVVTAAGAGSTPFPVEVVASNPGLYSRNGQGWGPGRIDNLDALGKRSENSSVHAALPGQSVILAATGFSPASSIRVVVGGRPAMAVLHQTSQPGQQELRFAIPSDAPSGCNVPVYVLAAPKRASNVVSMAIDAKGRCEGLFPSGAAPARFLAAVFSRTIMKATPVDSVYDEAVVSFASVAAGEHPTPFLMPPPPGTCVAYSGTFQTQTLLADSPSSAMVADLGGTELDAGPALTLSRDGGSRTIPGNASALGFFRARLGGKEVRFGPRALAPFLDKGEYRLRVPGGRDVAAFTASFAGPSPLEWTNRDSINTVDRSRPLTLEWRSAAPDHWVVAMATNVDHASTATGTVLCTALPAPGHFTIPPELLANLPASGGEGGVPYNRLFLGAIPSRTNQIKAAGLDAATILGLYSTGRFVDYR
jgi:uncharacterized protein (TIGR03437 family)